MHHLIVFNIVIVMNQSIIFVYGDEPFLIKEEIKKITTPYQSDQIDHLNNVFELTTLKKMLQSTGLFATSKLIVIKNPFFLSKKLLPKEEKELETLLKNHQNPDIKLLIYSTEKLDQRKKFVSYLKKNTQTKQYHAFKDWEQNKIIQWIEYRLKQSQTTIEKEAVFALEQQTTGSLEQCATEINTLLTYIHPKKHITLQDIKLLSGNAKATTYQLTEELKTGHYAKIFNTTNTLMSNQEDPIRLLGLIIATYRLYYQILWLKSINKTDDQIAKQLRKNSYYIKIISQKLNYTIKECANNLSILAKTDLTIKTGIMKPQLALSCAIQQMNLTKTQSTRSI